MPAVFAKMEIRPGSVISAELVGTRWFSDSQNAGDLMSDCKDAVGKFSRKLFLPGELLKRRDLTITNSEHYERTSWDALRKNAERAEQIEQYDQAEYYWFQAFDEAEREKNDARVMFCLNALGDLYSLKLEYANAEGFYRELIAKIANYIGKDNPSILVGLSKLSRVLFLQGRFTEAEDLVAKVETILSSNSAVIQPDTRHVIATLVGGKIGTQRELDKVARVVNRMEGVGLYREMFLIK